MPTASRCRRPTLAEVLLALYVLSRGRCTCREELARYLGCSPREVAGALGGLARLGLVQPNPPRLTMAGLVRAVALAERRSAPLARASERPASKPSLEPVPGSRFVKAGPCTQRRHSGPVVRCPATSPRGRLDARA